MNTSMMDKARSMLSGAGIAKSFWVESISTACYLKNRSPTSTLVDKTPQEVWYGNKTSIAYLKVFGCDDFAHAPKEKRSKMDNK